jgi:ankyrin repeat protein
MNTKHKVNIYPLIEELNLDNSKFYKFMETYTKEELRNMIIIGLKKGYTDLIKSLIDKISDDFNFDFDVVINVSAKCGYLDVIQYLHSNNKVNLAKLKDIVLKKSSFHSKHEILNWMIEENFLSVNEVLVYNASIGNIQIIKYFVEEKNKDIHFKDELVLRTAGYNGQLDTIKYLHGLGCDLNSLNDCVLRFCSEHGFFDVVKYCIDSGSNVHSYNDEAIRKSCIYGHLDIVKYLVQSGANYTVNSNEPLCKACSNGHIEVVRYLIGLGVIVSLV